MKAVIFFASALLLAACHESPTMTFGLSVRVRGENEPPDPTQLSCRPPGASDGSTTGSSVDEWEIGEGPPHLFLELEPDAEEDVYRVQMYLASEVEDNGIVWKPGEVLAERTYDSEFGETGAQDSFVVDFEGEPQIVEVQGLPPGASCP
jgi:hypothetical protein